MARLYIENIKEELVARAQAFVDRKYVTRADARQKEMGLAYVEAERQDLALEIARFCSNEVDAALATLSPPAGERREAIVELAVDIALSIANNDMQKKEQLIDILASGLVQDEVGWRDISTAPKNGTPFIGAFWTIRWADSHRKGDVVTCWWQPEFDAFISSCREMSLAPGLTFENGETRQLHSPVIEPITHWKPLDRPAIRSARDGGAES